MIDPQAYRQASAGCSPKCSESRRKGLRGRKAVVRDLRRAPIRSCATRSSRVDRLHLPSYTGFMMPKLEAVTNPSSAVTDVAISYPRDLTKQMLEYSAATRRCDNDLRDCGA